MIMNIKSKYFHFGLSGCILGFLYVEYCPPETFPSDLVVFNSGGVQNLSLGFFMATAWG